MFEACMNNVAQVGFTLDHLRRIATSHYSAILAICTYLHLRFRVVRRCVLHQVTSHNDRL